MELPKVRFVFAKFMKRHGLSRLTKPAFARLLVVSASSVQKWALAKKMPADYLNAIRAITKEDIRKMERPKQWYIYNLRTLRIRLGISQTGLAKKIKSCQSSISKYELTGRIPYNRLPFVQKLKFEKLKEELAKRQKRA